MKKQPTWSETLVGRRLPKDSPYVDQIMAGFVRTEGSFCGRMEPIDRWLRAPWKKCVRAGWVKSSGFGFGKGAIVYFLTDSGEAAAAAARSRVDAVREARNQWSRDFIAANKARVETAHA
ncbi:MAG: hypothetical protein DI604_17905 [Delftia acidovorans]|nr:MAG: hypothetical protein DI604_17905 [Delftia acidovorans]